MGRCLTAVVAALGLGMGAEAQDPPYAWLSGCWETADGRTRESWSAPQGGLLLGYSVTLEEDGTAAFFEHLRIEPSGDRAAYVASPGGGASTRFEATLVEPGRAIFSNPEHDFPQTIAYVRSGDALTATISKADLTEAVEIPMARRECP